MENERHLLTVFNGQVNRQVHSTSSKLLHIIPGKIAVDNNTASQRRDDSARKRLNDDPSCLRPVC
jgi:hypothetical protein